MHHPYTLLHIANVCHPDADPYERHRVMQMVAAEEDMDEWSQRLGTRRRVGVAAAMQMLSELERRKVMVEGFHEPTLSGGAHCPFGLWIVLLILTISIFMWMWSKKKEKGPK